MNSIFALMHRLAQRRRLLLSVVAAVGLIAAVAAIFALGPPAPEEKALPVSPTPMATLRTSAPPIVSHSQSEPPPALAVDEPTTTSYQVLAKMAAEMIYTWDARSSTFSEVYQRVRSWWDVLPDGSNPLTVMAQEFQATGVTAASFASLSGMLAYRTATATSSACDGQLAKVKAHPAPWVGLHVCTFTLRVTEHQTGGARSYSVPVSVMVNCPPAETAPIDRCVMVGFYASPDKIVY